MFDLIIRYSFYTLFFLTPFVWTSLNYELFEYNKMILTYGITTIIVGAWVLKSINDKRLTIKRTPLDIPLVLFLGGNILSTIFSMDPHTSFWGYYSRSNGGLLSLISYLFLYWAFVSNMGAPQVKNILKIGILSGVLISLWAIFEHFGVSLSCVILQGQLNADCWIQDVKARVFATLGQPNWLAAYLAMLIFPSLYFLLTSQTTKERLTYYLSLIILYLAFTFTYSRGPTLGLVAGLVIFMGFYLFQNTRKTQLFKVSVFQIIRNSSFLTHPVFQILLSFLIINILFGSALTSFRLVSKFASPVRPAISLPSAPSVGTQLENGGTESGQIRFIVWQGAIDIFKNYPIFGSGLETFAYSYYQYRPVSHNLTSEWDFLYNKAHNEYLNYLSTTGIVGFTTYLLFIGIFVYWCAKRILKGKQNADEKLFIIALLASYISYLVYNFFLFSVVIIAIFFYLYPALVFVLTSSTSNFKLPASKSSFQLLTSNIYKTPLHTKITKGLVILFTLYFLFSIFKLWYADILFNQGNKASDSGSYGEAFNLLTTAVDLNKNETLYRSELAYSAATASTALENLDATLSARLKDEAIDQMEITLNSSPKNVSLWRTAVRTYFELAALDPKFLDKTLESLDQAIQLAPTDPKLYYNKALVLETLGKKEQSLEVLKKAIELKPNYLEALAQLKQATQSAKP